MARQKTSPLEDIFFGVSKMPWWAGLTLALVSFLVLHALASRPVPTATGPGQLGAAMTGAMIATLARLGQYVFPFALGIAALVSGITAYRQKKQHETNASRYDIPASVAKRNYSPSRINSSCDQSQPTATLGNFHPETPMNMVIQSLQPQPAEVHSKVWNESVLQSIEWKRFETVTKEFLNMTGYVASETTVGADGGVDIRITKRGNDAFRGIVQCKAWNAYKVGVKPVRELFGIMAAENVKNGMLITSGTFTAEAEEFAKGKVLLIPGWKFLEHIQKLPEEKRQRLLEVALEGDYCTPTCPHCDIKMTLRESKKGRHAGDQFWGCVRYPRCKQTLIYKAE